MIEYKEKMKYSGTPFYTFIHILLTHKKCRTAFGFWNAIPFFFYFRHSFKTLLDTVPLSNNLCIHSMNLWWIYADQFYIQGNSFCSSKLSILLGCKEEFFCRVQLYILVGVRWIPLHTQEMHLPSPMGYVCQNKFQNIDKSHLFFLSY